MVCLAQDEAVLLDATCLPYLLEKFLLIAVDHRQEACQLLRFLCSLSSTLPQKQVAVVLDGVRLLILHRFEAHFI